MSSRCTGKPHIWTLFWVILLTFFLSSLCLQDDAKTEKSGKISPKPVKASPLPKITKGKESGNDCAKIKVKETKSSESYHMVTLTFGGITSGYFSNEINNVLVDTLASTLEVDVCDFGSPDVTTIVATSSVEISVRVSVTPDQLVTIKSKQLGVAFLATFQSNILASGLNSSPLNTAVITAIEVDDSVSIKASASPTIIPTGQPTAIPTEAPACFPEDAVVTLFDTKSDITLGELQYGDKILTVDRRGRQTFKEVSGMSHRLHNQPFPYVNLLTRSHTLKLSAGHYARICTSGCPHSEGVVRSSHVSEYVYARDVRIGDKLLVVHKTPTVHDDHNQLHYEEVVNSFTTIEKGLFAPFVLGADLVVNGVVVSPYMNFFIAEWLPSLARHEVVIYEYLFIPIHLIYKVIGPRNMETLLEWLNIHDQEVLVEGVVLLNFFKLMTLLSIPLVSLVIVPLVIAWALFGKGKKGGNKKGSEKGVLAVSTSHRLLAKATAVDCCDY